MTYRNKEIYFKISLNKTKGLGHFFRCFRLAETLPKNYKKYFVVDKLFKKKYFEIFKKKIEFIELYKNKKFINEKNDTINFLKILKNRNNIVVLDDFRLGLLWQKKIYKHIKKLVVFDDDQKRDFYCDIYINYKFDISKRVFLNSIKINKRKNQLLIGPKYCLLNNNLKKINKRNVLNKILFCFGNSFNFEKLNITIVKLLKNNFNVTIIIGVFSKSISSILKLVKKYKNLKVIINEVDISKFLNETDLFIGSAGNAIYEMAYLRKPSIFFEISSDQNNDIRSMEKIGHYFFLNKKDLYTDNFIKLILTFKNNYSQILKLSNYSKLTINKKGKNYISEKLIK